MFYHNLNPVILNLGSLEIRWYGLLYALGALSVYFMIQWLSKKSGRKITSDEVAEYILYTLIATVLGARIFYVLVYNPMYYYANPTEVFMLWKGGLSFHGGFLGALSGAYIFSRKRKIRLLYLADLTVIPLAFALFLGRIGNFINGELYGRLSDVPWAVNFKNADGFRHPSQLYEAAKNIIIFFTLLALHFKKKMKEGSLFLLFTIIYSGLRFIVEFFREPDIQIGYILGMTMGQILCIIFFIAGISGLVYLNKKNIQKQHKRTKNKRTKKKGVWIEKIENKKKPKKQIKE